MDGLDMVCEPGESLVTHLSGFTLPFERRALDYLFTFAASHDWDDSTIDECLRIARGQANDNDHAVTFGMVVYGAGSVLAIESRFAPDSEYAW